MDPSGILLKTSIFGDLSVPDVDELRADLSLRTFGRGQSVWFEGDRADALVVLAQGQLKAHRVSLDGRELIVQLLTAVGVTGEVGLFHPAGVRWFGLTAMTTADCFMIRRAPLLAFLARHPAAMQRMLEQLSLTAMTAANSFSQTAFEDISHRVASLLLSLADQARPGHRRRPPAGAIAVSGRARGAGGRLPRECQPGTGAAGLLRSGQPAQRPLLRSGPCCPRSCREEILGPPVTCGTVGEPTPVQHRCHDQHKHHVRHRGVARQLCR